MCSSSSKYKPHQVLCMNYDYKGVTIRNEGCTEKVNNTPGA